MTPLIEAAVKGHVAVISLLLAAKANVNLAERVRKPLSDCI